MGIKSYRELRLVLRGLSGLLITFFLFMFIGTEILFPESGQPLSLSSDAILQLSAMGMVLIGLGLAWKWELAGGTIAFIAFFVLAIINPEILKIPLLYFFPATAILFIVLWALTGTHQTRSPDR